MKPDPQDVPKPLAACTAGPIRVTYRDTDRMGYVYYAQYLVWFEIGRTTLLRQISKSYREWEDDHGIFLPVKTCNIQYRTPARYDDLILVETNLTRLTRASISLHYTIYRESDHELLAEGDTVHPFVDKNGNICKTGHLMLPQFFQNEIAIR